MIKLSSFKSIDVKTFTAIQAFIVRETDVLDTSQPLWLTNIELKANPKDPEQLHLNVTFELSDIIDRGKHPQICVTLLTYLLVVQFSLDSMLQPLLSRFRKSDVAISCVTPLRLYCQPGEKAGESINLEGKAKLEFRYFAQYYTY